MNSQYENLSDQYSAKPEGYYGISRPEMLPFVPVESTSVLEIGCSAGGFGELIKERRPGAVVWGIEPDANSAYAASARLDHVITGMFSPTLPDLAGKTFDAVCLNDVLEHMVNPETTLLDCKPLLSKSGVVIASIPNVLHFYNILNVILQEDWKYEEMGIMDNTHLRFFTKKSIIRMFESCGYEVLRIEGINPGVGLKFRAANMLMMGRLRDWKYVQFAIQARPAAGGV